MEAAFFAIVVVIAIVRGIYRFLRWATQSLKRLSATAGTYAPPQPMPAPPASTPDRGRSAPMPRPPLPNTPPPPAVSREATTSDFRDQEARLIAAEPPPIDAMQSRDTPAPATSSSPSLFGTTSDLVRALILQEVLGPPLSKRQLPPH